MFDKPIFPICSMGMTTEDENVKIAKLIIDRRLNGTKASHPCHKALPIRFDADGVNVEIVQCSVLDSNAGCSLIKINDSKNLYSKELETDENIVSLYGECSIMKIGDRKYLATVMNNSCEMANLISESGVFLLSAVPMTDDIIEWTILAPNSTYIRNFIKKIEQMGYSVKRELMTVPDADMNITPKQEEIIRYALENGYYDIPKKLTVEDLCDRFGCSKSTLSVMMRTAEKKILQFYAQSSRMTKIGCK